MHAANYIIIIINHRCSLKTFLAMQQHFKISSQACMQQITLLSLLIVVVVLKLS